MNQHYLISNNCTGCKKTNKNRVTTTITCLHAPSRNETNSNPTGKTSPDIQHEHTAGAIALLCGRNGAAGEILVQFSCCRLLPLAALRREVGESSRQVGSSALRFFTHLWSAEVDCCRRVCVSRLYVSCARRCHINVFKPNLITD